MENVKLLLFFAAFLGLIVAASVYAMSATDKADCHEWQQEAGDFAGFFITRNQKDQCDYYGIEINVPVQ